MILSKRLLLLTYSSTWSNKWIQVCAPYGCKSKNNQETKSKGRLRLPDVSLISQPTEKITKGRALRPRSSRSLPAKSRHRRRAATTWAHRSDTGYGPALIMSPNFSIFRLDRFKFRVTYIKEPPQKRGPHFFGASNSRKYYRWQDFTTFQQVLMLKNVSTKLY